jgi:transcriptional regulator
MYIPHHFRQDDPSELAGFITNNSFGTLVTVLDGVPFATPLPFLFDSERGLQGSVRGHMARANPQWHHLESPNNEVMVLFQGPHGYVSPSWYKESPSVPTWNYMAVHVYGVARITSLEELIDILRTTVLTYEQPRDNPWRFDSLSDEYVEKMSRGIVGFEIDITRVEGKFKLSQNRSEEDVFSVIHELEQSGRPESCALAEAMRHYNL